MPAEYLQNMSIFLLPGRRQVTTSQGKVVEYGDNLRFRIFGPPSPFVLKAAARPASRCRSSGKCEQEVVIVQTPGRTQSARPQVLPSCAARPAGASLQ